MASNNIAIGVASGNEASVEEHTYSTADSSPSKPYGGQASRINQNDPVLTIEQLEKQVERYNFLWTFVSCGYMMSWTAIGSLITFFQVRQGAAFYVALYCFFYLPGLPVSILQQRFDSAIDRKFGSANTFMARVCFAMAIKVAVLFYMPSIPGNFKHNPRQVPYVMLACMGLIGIFSWLANGTVTQMCSMFPSSSTMFFQTGQRAPVIIVCIGSLWNKNVPASEARFDRVCHTTALFVTIGWLAFVILARSDPGMYYFLQKDKTSSFLREPPADEERSSLLGGGNDAQGDQDGTAHESETPAVVARAVHQCRLGIFLNIFTSILVAAFFAYVQPGGDGITRNIGTILYFTRLFSDLLGRPMARMWRPSFLRTDAHVLRANCLRLTLVVVFFVYTVGAGTFLPKNDIFIILVTLVLYLSAGYLVVLSYEYAPLAVNTKTGKATAGTLMNSTFQLAQCSSVVLGVFISHFMKDPSVKEDMETAA